MQGQAPLRISGQKPDAVRELAMQLSQGRAFRGEGTACAKALRQEQAECV